RSHLKAAGKANWGGVKQALQAIEKARAEGLDVRADAYPYTAGSPFITALLPRWAHQGGMPSMMERLRDSESRRRIASDIKRSDGDWENLPRVAGWDNIVLLGFPPDHRLEGESIEQVARARGIEPADALMDLILESEGAAAVGVFDLSEKDVSAAITHPLTMIISDGAPSPGLDHPRLYGTFPNVLGEYVRSRAALPLEAAVRKMTSYVAQTHNLADRGVIAPGYHADLTLFDPTTVADRSTYEEPDQSPEGIEAVFVAGELVLREGELTGAQPGRPLVVA
ncbi:amidohydrolase family protein, partial [Chloroflexota bacterium]